MNRRGLALYLVLAVVLVVVLLTNAVLSIISIQGKMSNHQVRRVQAYYAGQAAINYALEQLRLNTSGWVPDTTTALTRYMCRWAGSGLCASPHVNESSLPSSINYILLTIGPRNATTNLTPVNATVNYTGF